MPFPILVDCRSYCGHSLIIRYSEQAFIANSAYIIDVIVNVMTVVMLVTMIIRKWRFNVHFLSFIKWVEVNEQIALSGSQESLTLPHQSPMLWAALIRAPSVITPLLKSLCFIRNWDTQKGTVFCVQGLQIALTEIWTWVISSSLHLKQRSVIQKLVDHF